MFINGLPVSSLFCYTALLCLHHVFLHTCLALSVLLPFMLCVPCPFHAPFLFCVFQLLHTASFYTPKSLSTAPISSLFWVFILSVHLLHPPCTVPLHALHRAIVLPIRLFTATPFFSTLLAQASCQVLCLIIITTLQLLWRLNPCVHHHWVL
jgi:hypothetical protein